MKSEEGRTITLAPTGSSQVPSALLRQVRKQAGGKVLWGVGWVDSSSQLLCCFAALLLCCFAALLLWTRAIIGDSSQAQLGLPATAEADWTVCGLVHARMKKTRD
jgi:hypothetical protein